MKTTYQNQPLRLALVSLLYVAAVADSSAAPPLLFNVGHVQPDQTTDLRWTGALNADALRCCIVQFDKPLQPAERQALLAAGIALGDYVPHNAYVTWLNEQRIVALRARSDVTWVGLYRDEWKLDPQLGRRQFQTPRRIAQAARGEALVCISLFSGCDPDSTIAQLSARPAVLVHQTFELGRAAIIVAAMPVADLPAAALLNDVQYIEDAPELMPRNSSVRWIVQSNQTDLTPVHARGIRGLGQIVGILDEPVDRDHCSFRDAANNTPGPNHRKIVAYNAPFNQGFHGTHVGGIVVGDAGADNDTRGLAYEGRLTYAEIPSFTEQDMLSALNRHHSQGARIHTNSWGDDGTTAYNGLCRAIDLFSYDNEDDLVLFAVTNTSTMKNPENAKNLIAVGATNDAPGQHNHCTGGIGPTADGRRKPEIYAPGCSIQSSSAGSGCGTVSASGTSMACPAVAGACMLARQYYMDGFHPGGTAHPADAFTPSGALVKATVMNAGTDMTGVSGYPSNLEGWGRVLLDDALYFEGDARKLGVLADVRNSVGLQTGDQSEYFFTVIGASERIKVTLVWMEPPASAGTGSGNAVVNDIDLLVVDSYGQAYRGNVFSGGMSVPGGSADPRNNVEQVHVINPALGPWTVRVSGAAVNQGRQGFALLVTGDLFLAPPDCNTNNTDDRVDVANGASRDCNESTVPDECELAAGSATDCDTNSTLDVCELAGNDCNTNAQLDRCDIAAGQADCDGNALPDACQPDCNTDGTPDACDTGADCNTNGTPDFCDVQPRGGLAVWGTGPLNMPIPDNAPSSGVTHTQVVSAVGALQDVNVYLSVQHTYLSDLIITLSHGGRTQTLWSRRCSSFDNMAMICDDAGQFILCGNPTQGVFRPTSMGGHALSGFNGMPAAGDWTLRVIDQRAGETGMLVQWSLTLTTPLIPPASPDSDDDGIPDECGLSPCASCVGDMSGDAQVDGDDVARFVECVLGTGACTCSDMNENGMPAVADAADIALFVDRMLHGTTCP